jgi:hypothetical protein
MVYTIKLDQVEFRYKHVAPIKPLYETLKDWFMEHDYKDPYGGESYLETLYYVDESQYGHNYWIWWRAFKNINSQIRFALNFDMLGLAVEDVQVVWQGKKYKAQNGEFTFYINARVEVDYKNQWEKTPIIKPFIEIMLKRVLKKDLEAYKRILERDMRELHAFIRTYYMAPQFIKEKESYHPLRGYGYA